MSDQDKNKFPGENNTGHIWDDNLRELLNEPPTWWRIGFHMSWILVVVYTLIYPSWPGLSTHFKGLTGWTAMKELKEDIAALDKIRGPYEAKLKTMSTAEIMANPELSEYVVRSAKVLFGDNCAACHGSGGQGNPGFPALVDDDWLYGGTLANIETTITAGRKGMMPAHAAMLSDAETDKLAQAIVSGKITSEPLYMEKGCVGCHGADAKGLSFMGSANLTDGIYRFTAKDQLASVKYTIKNGVNDASNPATRNAEMPVFGGGKLTDTDIKKLAIYVHKLGGGQ